MQGHANAGHTVQCMKGYKKMRISRDNRSKAIHQKPNPDPFETCTAHIVGEIAESGYNPCKVWPGATTIATTLSRTGSQGLVVGIAALVLKPRKTNLSRSPGAVLTQDLATPCTSRSWCWPIAGNRNGPIRARLPYFPPQSRMHT